MFYFKNHGKKSPFCTTIFWILLFFGTFFPVILLVANPSVALFWAIYSDLSRGHPKWWFCKGIPPKMALN